MTVPQRSKVRSWVQSHSAGRRQSRTVRTQSWALRARQEGFGGGGRGHVL